MISGITGGASLVKSAKYRAVAIELFSWGQNAFIFKLAKNRLPGDLNNDGLIDDESTYPSNLSFDYPYDGSSTTYQKPNYMTAPFVELFLEEITNFKPQKTRISTELETLAKNKALPNSKYIGNAFYFYKYNNETNTQKNNWLYRAPNGNTVSLHDGGYFTIDPNVHKNIDTKYDDGVYNDGRIRGACTRKSGTGNSTYDKAIEDKQKCGELMYIFDNTKP